MPKLKTPRPRNPVPFRKTLTSVATNTQVDDWELTHRDLKLPGAGPWTVRQRTLHGGKQEGVRLIEVDNGALRFAVTPTRGMGVLRVELDDVRLGWDSPVREVVHPAQINLTTHGGLGWLEGFNEFLVRCGLESFGPPGVDTFKTSAGTDAQQHLTLHGRIANIPASEVEVVVDRTPPHRIRVRGRVDERMLFGPQLELWTEISTEPRSNEFRVEDQVRNVAASPREFQLLYHVNYGPPLLAAGARFRAAIQRATPATPHAAAHASGLDTYEAPRAGFAEQVYFLELRADAAGQHTVLLHNAAADRGASMTFAASQFPCFTLWKNTAALADGYVTGLEPGTSYPNPRQVERQAGRVPQLAPGEARRFAIDFAILRSKSQVAKAGLAIERLQAVQGKARRSRNPRGAGL
jgi:hypothetical protein